MTYAMLCVVTPASMILLNKKAFRIPKMNQYYFPLFFLFVRKLLSCCRCLLISNIYLYLPNFQSNKIFKRSWSMWFWLWSIHSNRTLDGPGHCISDSPRWFSVGPSRHCLPISLWSSWVSIYMYSAASRSLRDVLVY